MRLLVAALLILAISGCRSASNHDPYLAAVDKYIASLNTAATNGAPVAPPPKPIYLECPVQPEPFPQPHSAGVGFSGDAMRDTAALGKLSTRSQGQCEQTNAARKQAYEDALRRYQQITTGRSAGQQGGNN